MSKVQLGTRITLETNEKLEQLIKHFTEHISIGKVNKQDIVELAIKELHDKYIGDRRSN